MNVKKWCVQMASASGLAAGFSVLFFFFFGRWGSVMLRLRPAGSVMLSERVSRRLRGPWMKELGTAAINFAFDELALLLSSDIYSGPSNCTWAACKLWATLFFIQYKSTH